MPYDARRRSHSAAFLAKTAAVDREAITYIALWATIAKTGGLDEIGGAGQRRSVRVQVSTFETHPIRSRAFPDRELYSGDLQPSRPAGSLIAFHRNDDLVTRLVARLEAEGRRMPASTLRRRPPVAETEAAGRAWSSPLAPACGCTSCTPRGSGRSSSSRARATTASTRAGRNLPPLPC